MYLLHQIHYCIKHYHITCSSKVPQGYVALYFSLYFRVLVTSFLHRIVEKTWMVEQLRRSSELACLLASLIPCLHM